MELDERNGSVGGNRGYVGYSMSKRASEARRSGRFPKTDFKQYYGMSEKVLSGLVDMGIVSNDEWHHTSKFGNRTVFYSFSEPSYLSCWEQCSDEIKRMFGKGNLNGVRELFDRFLVDDMEKQNNEHAMSAEYKAYCDDYRKRNDLFDPNKPFKASNGCIVKIEDGVPVVYLNGDRLSKRHGKNYRDAAMSEYLKEKDRWKEGMLSYSDYFNKNGHDMEINESVVERIVRESLTRLFIDGLTINEEIEGRWLRKTREIKRSPDYKSIMTKKMSKPRCPVGHMIVDRCTENNISINDLAELLQYTSYQVLTKVLSGKLHISYSTAEKLERIFNEKGLADMLMKAQADWELEQWEKQFKK